MRCSTALIVLAVVALLGACAQPKPITERDHHLNALAMTTAVIPASTMDAIAHGAYWQDKQAGRAPGSFEAWVGQKRHQEPSKPLLSRSEDEIARTLSLRADEPVSVAPPRQQPVPLR